MIKRVVNAKVACLDFSLMKAKMKMGVQVLIENPDNLDKIRERFEPTPLFYDLTVNTDTLCTHSCLS